MCGLAGAFNFKTGKPVASSMIQAMCDPIRHRGPDGDGIYTDGEIGLGHRRLSIIDVDPRSNQPMTNVSESHSIVFNGEAYNYLELAPSLKAAGVQFKTESDTEVLLNLYAQEGPACLEKLNGMYAFAIWDRAKRELFIARDRLGIKPLYYYLTEDGILFASEVKSILAALPSRPPMSESVIDTYMSFGYVPGTETMFEGIKKLPPGHYLTVRNGQLETRCYWDIECHRDGPDLGLEHYKEEAIELLEDAVKLRLRSDVPLGVFLSGGVDSSAVVAMMRKIGADPVRTYSVRWDHGSEYDETEYAKKIARQFKTEHTEYTMSEDDFVSFLPKFQWLMDEPVTEAAAVSLYYIAREAKKDVTVVLSGEGADEAFGGYPIYRYMRWVSRYASLPGPLRKFAGDPLAAKLGGKFQKYAALSKLPLEQAYLGVSFYEGAEKRSVYSDKMMALAESHPAYQHVAPFYEKTRDWDNYSRMQYLDVKTWLADDLLIKADRMSMAASMELRVPFLDYRFFEFSSKVPVKHLVGEKQSKKLLKSALEPYLPQDILYRKKMGFPTPISSLLEGRLGDMAGDMFASQAFRERGYFASDKVQDMLRAHRSGERDHHRILWQLLIFELWCNSFQESSV